MIVTNSIQILKKLQYPTGLFAAASAKKTGYDKAWIRDNIYASLGFEAINDIPTLTKTYHALLDLMKQHEYKIDWMIKQPEPKDKHRYIHARYNPLTGEELKEEWGNKQNDAVGALLFKIGELTSKKIKILRNEHDKIIVQKLVDYLEAIQYWNDKDNGMWEEQEELHASSVGACIAGLKAVKSIVEVSNDLIKQGEKALNKLLPNESATKETDLALLSLIYPYNVVSDSQRNKILYNVHTKLEKSKGVIRYKDDKYYNNGKGEAEWTMGIAWLAVIYKNIDEKKHKQYIKKSKELMNTKGELPELYLANENIHNENSPLGWAQSLYVVAAA